MQESYKEVLYRMIGQGELEKAFVYLHQNIEKYQNKECFVHFYILLNIWKEECQAGVTDIFSSPLGRNPDRLLEHYTRIKLFLRRFEYMMPDEARQEALQYFIEMKVSPYALFRMAQFACIAPKDAFLELANCYEKNGRKEIGTIFYQAAKTS